MTTNKLITRLDKGPVICAEGFLFEIERRGYMSSGEFVPMVSLEHPEALENLHRDFQHAGSDIVEAFYKAAHSKCKNEIFNIGSNQTYSINYSAKLLKGSKIYLPKRPGEPNCTWADTKKAKKLLGWQPKINLKEGVKILMENIDYWKYAPVWDKNKIKKATKNWFKYLS